MIHRAALSLGLIVGFMLGCSSSSTMPKTYSAKGKVVFKDGQPLTIGSIDFVSATDANLKATGFIEKDGSFVLKVRTEKGDLKPGLPAGSYKVTVTPGYTIDQTKQAAPVPVQMKEPYTIKSDDSNDITITLPGNAPKN